MSSQPPPALKFKLKQKPTTTAKADVPEVAEKKKKNDAPAPAPAPATSLAPPSQPTNASQPPMKLKLKLPSAGIPVAGGQPPAPASTAPASGKKRSRPLQSKKATATKTPGGGVKRSKLASQALPPLKPPPIKKFKLKMGGGPSSHPLPGISQGTPAAAAPSPAAAAGAEGGDRKALQPTRTAETIVPVASPMSAQPSATSGPAETVPMDLAALDEPFIQPQSQSGAQPPSKQELSRLLSRLVEKDTMGLFHKPVTEDVAPGYFSIIKTPMDLSTMRQKLESGAYKEWSSFDSDVRLMFRNALVFNPVGDRVYLYALKLGSQTRRMLINAAMSSQERSKSGQRTVTGGRGKDDKKPKAQDLKQIAAARKAQLRAQREAARAVARAEQRAAQEAKILKRAFGGGEGMGVGGDAGAVEARATLRVPVSDAFLLRWGGLGGGASSEGAPFGLGRQYLQPTHYNGVEKEEDLRQLYKKSIERFASRFYGKTKELVLLYAKKIGGIALPGGPGSSVGTQHSPEPPPPQGATSTLVDGNNAFVQQ